MQQGWRWEVNDGLDLEGVKANSIFGYDKSKKTAIIHAKDTLVRIEPNIVTSTVEENMAEVFRMVLMPS